MSVTAKKCYFDNIANTKRVKVRLLILIPSKKKC